MTDRKPDNEPAKATLQDRGEALAMMEPLKLSEGVPERGELTDLAFELAQASAAFSRSQRVPIIASLANLVRSMNCYYSNLIEGHDTHPIDIERALKNDYSADTRKRSLQREASAHIAVQRWIDNGGLDDTNAVTINGAREIHRRFCSALPPDLLVVTDPDTGDTHEVVPGAFRERDVKVGHHVPISPGAVPRFMRRFAEVYAAQGKTELILATAAIHHRFSWIHPFLDGNGRVVRLMSHALLRATLDTGSLWSISRGLARSVDTYKQLLGNCDLPRRNDLDGRGHLGQGALVEFTRFFLETCLDQVRFMEQLVQPDQLRERILRWAHHEADTGRLPAKSATVLDALLYQGELPRGAVPALLDVSERQSRRVVSTLIEREVVTSTTTRAALHLAFPAALAHEWMPGLFPPKAA